MKKGKVTKEFILQRAFEIASEDGLKPHHWRASEAVWHVQSGLFAHFNSKLNLQLSVSGVRKTKCLLKE